MLLAIDVGNTAIKVAHEDAFGVLRVFRGQTGARPIGELLALALDSSATNPFVSICAIASVAPQYDPDITDALSPYGIEPRFLNAENAPGLEIRYETPMTLGADRIANALFLADRVEGPSIGVDFGTATKLDVVDGSGTFLGGAILPGLPMMIDSLAKGTAKLPEIEIGAPSSAIGRSTKGCLQSGTVLALAKAVEGLIAEFQVELNEPATAIGTGGLASELAPLCPSVRRIEPNLTLEGLFIAARRWAARG